MRTSTSVRMGIAHNLSRHLKSNYSFGGRENRLRCKGWIRNFRTIAPLVPPRVLVCLLRSGLHGWYTKHRFGENSHGYICGRYNDSVAHTINCNAVRRIWRCFLHPPFDGLELLGFIEREHRAQTRVDIICILFGVFEFVRFWSHNGGAHQYYHLQHCTASECAGGQHHLPSTRSPQLRHPLARRRPCSSVRPHAPCPRRDGGGDGGRGPRCPL